MTKTFILALALLFSVTISACDSSDPAAEATGTMEAKIDGADWQADNATATKVGAAGFSTIMIAGANTSTEVVTISLLNVSSTGTFDLSSTQLASMSWTPGSVPIDQVYNAQTGSVTITRLDDDRVEGTFFFNGRRSSDNGTVGVTQGSFDVGYGPGI